MMTEENNWVVHQSFRTTEAEDEIIRQRMKVFGIRKKSLLFRTMVLNGYLLKLDLLEMHEAVRLMGKMSGNINQIARRLNEHGSIYETEMDEIVDEQRELKELLSQLLQRLGHDHGLRTEKKHSNTAADGAVTSAAYF